MIDLNDFRRHRPADGWRPRRIWIAGAFGAMLAGSQWILDFWPLGAGNSFGGVSRGLFELSQLLFLLPMAALAGGLLIAAGIALWYRRFLRMTSNILAIIAIPACITVVAKVPLFDPWLWYAIANSSRFEALAASRSPSNEPKYAVLEIRDVSTGLAGVSPNHFIDLIYDESDAVGLEPSDRPSVWQTRRIWPSSEQIPKGRRLYGHIFRVDDFD